MIDEPRVHALDGLDAYRALCLLPGASRALAGEVYRVLRDRCLLDTNGEALDTKLERLDSAYETIKRTANGGGGHDGARLRSPWSLLRIDAAAPHEIVEVAYRVWQRDHGRKAIDLPRRPARAPAPVDEDGSSGRNTQAVAETFEPLADETVEATKPPRIDDAEPAQTNDSTPPQLPASLDDVLVAMPNPLVSARLVLEAGTARPPGAAISERPLRIGSDPTCDIVVDVAGPRRAGLELRLWRRQGRVLFHGVAGQTFLNGHAVGWAVLEHGDTVHVGEAAFRYEDGDAASG